LLLVGTASFEKHRVYSGQLRSPCPEGKASCPRASRKRGHIRIEGNKMKQEQKPVEPIQSAPAQKDIPAKAKSLQQEVAEKFFD
jgi:hypothetical protein